MATLNIINTSNLDARYATPSQVDAKIAALATSESGDLPANVFNTGNSLTDAIGDGSSHPLSTRFASLADAQAVFPAATALTEEIDRHALQLVIDNNAIVAGRIDRQLLIDAPVYTRTSGYQTLQDLSLLHAPGINSIQMLATGNCRSSGFPTGNPSAASYPDYYGLTLRNIIVDQNQANLTGGSKVAVYLVHCSDLVVEDFEVRNAQGNGFVHTGTSDGNYSERQSYIRVKATGTVGPYGFRNSLRTRKVQYTDIQANDNSQSGIYFDHSEANATNITACGNGSSGIHINNVFSCNFRGLRTTQNGHHGIYVLGLVESIGDDWLSMNNGLSGAGNLYSDVYWTGDNTQGYGVTRDSTVKNIIAGRVTEFSDTVSYEDYALYIEDGVTTNVRIEVRYVGSTGVANRRLPASLGNLVLIEDSPNAAGPVYAAGQAPAPVPIVALTQTAYDAIATPDSTTLYVITGP